MLPRPASLVIRNRPRHNPCVIAHLLQPALFHARHINVQIETKGEHSPGMAVADGWRMTGHAPNAMVMGGVDRDGFYRLLTERLGGKSLEASELSTSPSPVTPLNFLLFNFMKGFGEGVLSCKNHQIVAVVARRGSNKTVCT